MLPFKHYSSVVDVDYKELFSEIPFCREEINSNGVWVKESRLTCWMSDKDIELEYSDKKMKPIRLTKIVSEIRDSIYQKYNIYFDSVLANYYLDNKVGMRYHSDPLNDIWDTHFMILSIGDSRKIIFREIENIDKKYEFEMESGDIIHMFDDCQDKYQHSVRKSKICKGPRISLVFKRESEK